MNKKRNSPGRSGGGNPVAKYANKVNRSVIFQDRSKYRRNAKHKLAEPFPILFLNVERVSEKALCRLNRG